MAEIVAGFMMPHDPLISAAPMAPPETKRKNCMEAFDKIARFMGLGFPGGPAIDKAAEGGDASMSGVTSGVTHITVTATDAAGNVSRETLTTETTAPDEDLVAAFAATRRELVAALDAFADVFQPSSHGAAA